MLRIKHIQNQSAACSFLKNRSEEYSKQSTEQNKMQGNEVPESAWLQTNFQRTFAIPNGFIGFYHNEIPTIGKPKNKSLYYNGCYCIEHPLKYTAFSFSFQCGKTVAGAKAQEKVRDCAIIILGSNRVQEKVLLQEMESVLVALVTEIRQLAKQALKMQIVSRAKSKKMTRCGKIIGNYNDLREVWLREVPLNEKLLEDFFDILYLQFDSIDGAAPGQMDRVVFHVMESLEIWNLERNEETESYSNKTRSYKSSIRTICYNVLRDSFRNCLVGDKSKRSERSHGIMLTKHAKKEKMEWLSKASYSKYKISTFYKFGFQKEIHVKGWDGQKHRAWKAGKGTESRELVRLQYI